jgi:hypothetical protein
LVDKAVALPQGLRSRAYSPETCSGEPFAVTLAATAKRDLFSLLTTHHPFMLALARHIHFVG